MAVNKPNGDGHRIGAVKERVQYFNPITKLWVKCDANNNRFMANKADGSPHKGVTKK